MSDSKRLEELTDQIIAVADTLEASNSNFNSAPIEKFKSVEEIESCACYYVNLLGLQDWRISYAFTDEISEDSAGECDAIFEEKCARISIRQTIPDDLWFKEPQELVLIHELLHCKMPLFYIEHLEGQVVEMYYHSLIDDWARSIFHVKYGIDNKWYYFNRGEDDNE